MNSVIIFQGQGSYRTSYFNNLLKEHPKLNIYLEKAENLLGWSPKDILNKYDNIGSLTTDYAQPMIFLMEFIGWCAYKERIPEQPEYMMGHSLGEITALTAAGVFSYEQGLNLVKERGILMQESNDSVPQGMLAILGLNKNQVEDLCLSATKMVGEPIYCANINGESNIVVSGSQKALNYIASLENIKSRPLAVTKAFHTEYMKSAAEKFRHILNSIEYKEFSIPVISNVTALPYQTSWSVSTLLYRQIYSPVLWTDSIKFLKERGIDLFLQISDTGLYETMDRNALTEVAWGNLKDWTDGNYYNYNQLYPSSRNKSEYRPEIIGEILSSMNSTPWPSNTDKSIIEYASVLYRSTVDIFDNNMWDYNSLLNALNMLKEVLILKQETSDNADKKCRQILEKYGFDQGNKDEKIF